MNFDKKKSKEIAQKFLGLEFRLGGRGEDGTIDCRGILLDYYNQFGIQFPDFTKYDDWSDKEEHYLNEYATFSRKLSYEEKPECGDFILFKNIEGASNHAAIYLGDNLFVHSYKKIGVKIDSLTQKHWKDRMSGFFRVKDKE
jgi:cell wall-associated NlpC family hydrolase